MFVLSYPMARKNPEPHLNKERNLAESKPVQKSFDYLMKTIFACAAGTFIIAACASYPVVFGLIAVVIVLITLLVLQRRRAEELRDRNRDLQRDLDRARRW